MQTKNVAAAAVALGIVGTVYAMNRTTAPACSDPRVLETVQGLFRAQLEGVVGSGGAGETELDAVSTVGPFGQNDGRMCRAQVTTLMTLAAGQPPTPLMKVTVQYTIEPSDDGRQTMVHLVPPRPR